MIFLGLAIAYLVHAINSAIIEFCPAGLLSHMVRLTIQAGQVAMMGVIFILYLAEYLLSQHA